MCASENSPGDVSVSRLFSIPVPPLRFYAPLVWKKIPSDKGSAGISFPGRIHCEAVFLIPVPPLHFNAPLVWEQFSAAMCASENSPGDVSVSRLFSIPVPPLRFYAPLVWKDFLPKTKKRAPERNGAQAVGFFLLHSLWSFHFRQSCSSHCLYLTRFPLLLQGKTLIICPIRHSTLTLNDTFQSACAKPVQI